MATRTITGTYPTSYNGKKVKFWLRTEGVTDGTTSFLTEKPYEQTITNGAVTFALPVPAADGWEWTLEEPGYRIDLVIASGSATTIEALKVAAGVTAISVSTVQTLLASYTATTGLPFIDAVIEHSAARTSVGGTPTETAYTGLWAALVAADASNTRKTVVLPSGAYGLEQTIDLDSLTNKGHNCTLIIEEGAEIHWIDFDSADGSGMTVTNGAMFNVSSSTAARRFTVINRGRIIGNRATLTTRTTDSAFVIDTDNAQTEFYYYGQGGVVTSFSGGNVRPAGRARVYIYDLETTDSGGHGLGLNNTGRKGFFDVRGLRSYANAKLGVNIRGREGSVQGEVYSNTDAGFKISDRARNVRVDLYTHHNQQQGGREQPMDFDDLAGTCLTSASAATNDTSILIDGFSATTGVVEAGTRFRCLSGGTLYTVKTDATIASNAVTVSVLPPVAATVPNNTTVQWFVESRITGAVRSAYNQGRGMLFNSARGIGYRTYDLDVIQSESDLLGTVTGLALTAASNTSGTTAVYTYTGSGEVQEGDNVTIAGVSPAAYNVTRTVLAASTVSNTTYQFTITIGASASTATAFGTVSANTQTGALYINMDGGFVSKKTRVTGTQTSSTDLIYVTHSPDTDEASNEALKTQSDTEFIELGTVVVKGVGASASGVHAQRGHVSADSLWVAESKGYGVTAKSGTSVTLSRVFAEEEASGDMTAVLNADTGTIRAFGGDISGAANKTAGTGNIFTALVAGTPGTFVESVPFYASSAALSHTTSTTWQENSNRMRHRVDTGAYTQVRLVVFIATAEAGGQMRLECNTGSWVQATSENTYIDASSGSAITDTGWLTLVAGAIGTNKVFRVTHRNTTTPGSFTTGSITAQFR